MQHRTSTYYDRNVHTGHCGTVLRYSHDTDTSSPEPSSRRTLRQPLQPPPGYVWEEEERKTSPCGEVDFMFRSMRLPQEVGVGMLRSNEAAQK